MIEDDLQWKRTFDGGQPLMEYDLLKNKVSELDAS